MTTLGDILDTSIAICKTGPGSLRNLLGIHMNDREYQEYRLQEVDHDRFILVFSSNPLTIEGPPPDMSSVSGFTTLFISPYTPVLIGPLLSMLATAVVLYESIYGMENQVLTALTIAGARTIPVIDVGDALDDMPEPFLRCHITHSLPDGQTLETVLRDLVPSSRFPFILEDQADGSWQFKPLAPFDFLSDAEVNTPRFQQVMARMFHLVTVAKEKGRLTPKTRYYAAFVGDLCVAVENEAGEKMATMIAQG